MKDRLKTWILILAILTPLYASLTTETAYPSTIERNNSGLLDDRSSDLVSSVEDGIASLVVGLSDNELSSYEELMEIITKHKGKIVNEVRMNGEVVSVVVEVPAESMYYFTQEVKSKDLANYVEPRGKLEICSEPDDPYWNLQWGPRKIETNWAWNTTVGTHDVLVAIVDTGIDYTHPDLTANYVEGGYDWANNDTDPMDDHGHGTHCAGIIAATLNNTVGVAGLAQVRVMAEKVLDSGGEGYADWVASGIIHATDMGADVISMSLGDRHNYPVVYEAVRYAYEKGVLLIAAAGNENTPDKLYPAGYDEVIAVTATDQNDYKASFSNWGYWVELAAPGVDVYSTVPWGYESWSGTSMACPHVSGVAALVWSQYPDATRDWVRLWLRYTTDDLGVPGFDVDYGYGRVNARKAVERSPPEHDLLVDALEKPKYIWLGNHMSLDVIVENFGKADEYNVTVQLLVEGELKDSTSIDRLANYTLTTVSLLWTPLAEGTYNVTLYVVPVPGEIATGNNVMMWTISVTSSNIVLDTDKLAYKLGENVTITLTNISNETITIIGDPPILIYTYPQIKKVWPNWWYLLFWYLAPGQKHTIVWNQYNAVNKTYCEPGTYIVVDNQGWGLRVFFTIADITVPDDYQTIQEAINNADEGDMILVRKGTHYENVVVNKTVSLFGEKRSTTVIDGGGIGTVVTVTANNSAISGFTIRGSGTGETEFRAGILLNNTSHCNITKNDILENEDGIILIGSPNNNVAENNLISNNSTGILVLFYSSNNTITQNNMRENNGYSILVWRSSYNNISANIMRNDWCGLALGRSSNNTISLNTIKNNYYGIYFNNASFHDAIFHNNLINNTEQVHDRAWEFGLPGWDTIVPSKSSWDDGYPSGGNYWSDYTGVDLLSGPYQNETGSDGIGDVPYVINADNRDNYPLTKPYPWDQHDIGITMVTTSKTAVGQGFSSHITVTIFNYGIIAENFTLSVYANTTTIQTINITLASRTHTTVAFTWSTTGFAKGNYTISAIVTLVLGEIDTDDNTFVYGVVQIAKAGDFGTILGGYCDFDDLCDYQDLWLFRRAYTAAYHELCDFDNNLDVDYLDLFQFRKCYINP